MATGLDRRRCLSGLLLAGWWPCTVRADKDGATPVRCVAAWDGHDGRHWVGLLQASAAKPGLEVLATQALPTRAHGLTLEPDGSVWVVARRPGEWLLRWHPLQSRPPQWQWLTGQRVLGGHALVLPGAPVIYTIEQDGNTAEGWLVARDRRSLAELATWPTGGLDPHMALADGPDHVLVANGGVPPAAMARPGQVLQSSLVRLSLTNGKPTGSWTLPDRQLSLRHLARHASGCVGIALQAEHAQATERLDAPLLALFEGDSLRAAQVQPGLGGYGGDIAADAEGFVVSASRASSAAGERGALARWDLAGRSVSVHAWPQAGALGAGWAAGATWQTPWGPLGALQSAKVWDNHLGS